MTRPWRLTRRQRVEMEAALAGFRRAAGQGFGAGSLAAAFDALYGGGRMRCGDDVEDTIGAMCAPLWGTRRGASSVHIRRDMIRTLRARVAIALRAALRADEDARCEEVRAREAGRWPLASHEGHDAAWESADALREWPEMRGPSRFTGVRRSALEGMRAMGLPIDPEWETCEAWNRRGIPVYACALALWERVDFSPAIPRTSATSRK